MSFSVASAATAVRAPAPALQRRARHSAVALRTSSVSPTLRTVPATSAYRLSLTHAAHTHTATIRRGAPRAAVADTAAPPEEPEAEIASTSEAEEENPAVQKGAKPIPTLIAVGVGLAVRFLIPVPAGVDPQAWQLLAIFMSTVVGLILEPLPVPAWAFCGLSVAVLSKTLTWQVAFAAFTNDVIWLITASFFFARGIVQSGLGGRIAQLFVSMCGASTLGLSYGLTFAEGVLALAMPSNTARAGGVFLPVIQSLSEEAGSKPGKSAKKLGAFLSMSQCHGASTHSSSLFLTGAAQNLLCVKLAQQAGVAFPNPWMQWFVAASVPCLVSMVVTPWIIYKLFPPEITDTPQAPAAARAKLKAMGGLSRDESIMLLAMSAAIVIWVFGFGLPGAAGAMLGLVILLCTGVMTWDDCLDEGAGWSTLVWFSVLVGFSSALNDMGLIDWLSSNVSSSVSSLGLPASGTIALLLGAYFAVHYFFASQTAQVASLFSAFMAMIVMAGGYGLPTALALAFTTNLFGGISHYASGQSVVYYNAGYVSLKEFWILGAQMAVINSALFVAMALPWWKFLGLI